MFGSVKGNPILSTVNNLLDKNANLEFHFLSFYGLARARVCVLPF